MLKEHAVCTILSLTLFKIFLPNYIWKTLTYHESRVTNDRLSLISALGIWML